VKMFDVDKTIIIELPYDEKTYDITLSCFHTIPERYEWTNGQTDGQADFLHQYRASVC